MKNRLPNKIRWLAGLCSILVALSMIMASCTAAVTSTTTGTTNATTTTITTTTTATTTTTTLLPVTTLPPTSTTTAATTTAAAAVLTVVNGGLTQTYTLAQLQALEAAPGYGTTKNGTTISGPFDYVGVKFTTLLKAAGGMTSGQALTLTAQNGATEDLSYAQVYQGAVNTYTLTGSSAAAGQQPLFMLIYSMNGNPLDAKTGPFEVGVMTEDDRASDASLWLPMTTQITIHPATRTVTDSTGAVVTIPWTVNRIADAWHANNEIVMLLGGASKLVATTTVVQGLPWFVKLDPAIANIPAPFTSTAGQVNMEMLIATSPDVLLCSAGSFTAATMAQFAAANIPVVQMPAATFADLQTTVNITAQVIGPQAQTIAANYISYLNSNIQEVTAVTSSIPASQRPTVLHTSQYLVLSTDGAGSLIDAWINYAGGVDVASATVSGNQKAITAEQIAAWNPSIIIVGTAPNQANVQAILNDPQWSSTAAVQNKQVYANPTGVYLWDRYSAEEALQIIWAAKLLWPSKFASIDIVQQTKYFYSTFFHYQLTDADVAAILAGNGPPS
ncbi:MAG: ABC transporter substrate-binding protein [Dehalococcoidales bacterium]|jgi:iron complex transport system substrate-binding protein